MKKQENMREDKHLLPKAFKQKETCEWSEIYLIFNHKNIWANLQNADPMLISYELHDDTLWLPFVRDSTYPHRWDDDDFLNFKRWQKFVNRADPDDNEMYTEMENENNP